MFSLNKESLLIQTSLTNSVTYTTYLSPKPLANIKSSRRGSEVSGLLLMRDHVTAWLSLEMHSPSVEQPHQKTCETTVSAAENETQTKPERI